MQYINPIEILQLSNVTDSSQIDSDTIKKAKRRLFADIDLSDNGYFNYYGLELSKSDCEKAIDELSNNDLKEFYLYLTSNKKLNEFLVTGNEDVFYSFKQDSIFKLSDFINFISPYYAPKFDKALSNVFEVKDIELLQSILKTSFFISQDNVNIAYKSVSNILGRRLADLSEIRADIETEESVYDDDDLHEIVDLVTNYFSTELLNYLPNYFQSQILKIANEINYLSVAIWDNFDNTQVCQDLLEHILTLNIDGLNKPIFQKNYEIVKRKNQERIEQSKNAPFLKTWAVTLLELRKYIDEVESETLSSSLAFTKTKELFSVSELNNLPDYGKEIRTQIGFAIRSLSVSIWNKCNDITSALNTINLASQINLDDEARAKIQQDLSELVELEKKYRGVLVCHFCEKNSPDENSSLEILIYKEIHRSYFPRRVKFSQASVTIPRCKSCKEIHSKGNSQHSLYFFGFLLAGVIIGAMTEDSHFIIGGIIGGVVGWIVGTAVKGKSVGKQGIKDDSGSPLRNHPLLIERMKQGWTFSKPSA
jgi:hypothetical protein